MREVAWAIAAAGLAVDAGHIAEDGATATWGKAEAEAAATSDLVDRRSRACAVAATLMPCSWPATSGVIATMAGTGAWCGLATGALGCVDSTVAPHTATT